MVRGRSHGLDLSFVTHLFLVNRIDDREAQVEPRTSDGRAASVRVEAIHMWND